MSFHSKSSAQCDFSSIDILPSFSWSTSGGGGSGYSCLYLFFDNGLYLWSSDFSPVGQLEIPDKHFISCLLDNLGDSYVSILQWRVQALCVHICDHIFCSRHAFRHALNSVNVLYNQTRYETNKNVQVSFEVVQLSGLLLV